MHFRFSTRQIQISAIQNRMENVHWPHIQSFLAIAKYKSLSAAAAAIGSSQPTLGRHLNSLEEALDLRLFYRQPSGLKLTRAGLDLLAHAETVALAVNEFVLAAGGRPERLSGTVCITASVAFTAQFLPPILTKLRNEEPGLEIELIASDQAENLLLREADIAVRMFRPTQPDLITRKLGEIQMGAFASIEYLDKFGAPADLKSFTEHSLIASLKGEQGRDVLRRLGLEIDASFFNLRCDDPIVAWQMVLAGFGIGFGVIAHADAEPRVQRVCEFLPPLTWPIWLTSNSKLKSSKSIRRVFEFLAAEIGAISRA